MKKRNDVIDIIRGYAIIFVVFTHCGFPFSKFLYLFHNALFFIVSGWFLSEKKSEDFLGVKKFTFSKIKSLWIPYVLTNGAFLLLNNFLCRTGLYLSVESQWIEVGEAYGATDLHHILNFKEIVIEILKIFVFMGGTELGGATWFLRVLFFAEIIFVFIEFVLKKITNKYLYVEILLAFLFSTIGRLVDTMRYEYDGKVSVLIANASVCLMVYGLLVLGRCLSLGYNNIQKYNINGSDNLFVFLLGCIGFLFTILIYSSQIEYFTKPYGILVSLCGWFMIWGLSFFTQKYFKYINRILMYIGKHSLPIFIGHFGAFKLGNIIVANIEKLPIYYIGAFATIEGRKWWPLYSVIGISVPLLLYVIYSGAKKIKSRYC